MSQLPPDAKVPIAEPVSNTPPLSRRATGSVKKHYSTLSGWRKLLLILSLCVALLGTGGTIAGYLRGQAPERVEAQATIEQVRSQAAPGASLTPDQQAKLDHATEQMKSAGHWFYEKTAPHLARIGFGFFVAFILGYAFRQFIKTMASLAAIVLVLGGVAAYFGYIDLSKFRGNLTASTGWISDQLTGAKDVILKFIGASLSGTVGFVVGFMRR